MQEETYKKEMETSVNNSLQVPSGWGWSEVSLYKKTMVEMKAI